MNHLLKILVLTIIHSFIFPYCVTFNLNLNNFNEAPDGYWVARANGNWNNWGTGITLNDSDGDGIHTATDCSFSSGSYEFVFALTGEFDQWSNWGLVGNPPMGGECDWNPNDNYANYGFEVQSNNIELQTYAWNCCGLNDCDYWEGCNTGQLATDDSYLYGRFEVRMKSADGDGLVSSFFTYNTNWDNDMGNLNVNEIDIEMTGNRDNSVQFTTHHPGNPNSWSEGEIIEVGFNPHADFHDYAIEWTNNSVKWFVDGEEVYQQPYSIVNDLNLSQKIIMNLWPTIWEDWVGEWDNQDTPKHVYYDYVKYYEYTPLNGNYGSNNSFLLLWEDDFDEFDSSVWDDNSSGSFGANLCSFSPSNTNFYNGHLILSLTDLSESIDCNEITGDINMDYLVNVIDAVALVNTILNNSSLEVCQTLASDMDFNNELNVIDVVSLTQIILQD